MTIRHLCSRPARVLTLLALGHVLLGPLTLPSWAKETQHQPVPQAWRVRHEPAILEAAIRRQLATQAGRPEIACLCLAVQQTLQAPAGPPGAALLARLKRHRPPVRPLSACRVDQTRVVTVASARPALSISVGPVYWNTTDRVSVDSAWQRDGQSAVSESATFVLREGQWTFVASAAALPTLP